MPMKRWLDETQREKEQRGIKAESGGGREMKGPGRQKERHFSFKEPLARECLD